MYTISIYNFLEKMHPSYKQNIIKKLNRVFKLSTGVPEQNLESAYLFLGKCITRRKIILQIQELSHNYSGRMLPPKIEEIIQLLEVCNKQIDLAEKLIMSLIYEEEKKEI